jgi:hypothetical protein
MSASQQVNDFYDYEDEEYDDDDYVDEQLSEYFSNTAEIKETKNINLIEFAEKQKKDEEIEKKKKNQNKTKTSKTKKQLTVEFEEENFIQKKKVLEGVTLDEVNYKMNVNQYLNMNFETTGFNSISSLTVNPKYIKELIELQKNLYNINNERRKKRLREFTAYELKDMVVDGNKDPIPTILSEKMKDLTCLRRYHHAQCLLNGNVIAIHGGENRNTQLNDIVLIDTLKSEITIINKLSKMIHQTRDGSEYEDYNSIPNLSHHQMVPVGEHLLIFGGVAKPEPKRYYYGRRVQAKTFKNEMGFYFVNSPLNPNKFHFGIKVIHHNSTTMEYLHPKRNPANQTYITSRSDFTVLTHHHDYYLFGGKNIGGNSARNDLFKISFSERNAVESGNQTTDYHLDIKEIKMGKDDNWPCERFGHAAEMVGDQMIVLGGVYHSQPLNDLFIFDVKDSKWTEVITTSPLPPLYDFSLSVVNNQILFVYGGVQDEKISHAMYSCDLGKKEWKIMSVMNRLDADLGDLQIPIKGHRSQMIANQIFIIGGTNGEIATDNAVTLNDIYEPGSSYMLTEYLTQQRENEFMCDVSFVCQNINGEICEIKAHKCILACRCPYLSKLVKESKDESISMKEIIAEVLDAYISFLYSGSLKLIGKENIDHLLKLCKDWNPDIYSTLFRICTTGSSNLSISHEILEKLEEDLSNLVDSELFSDLTIRVGDITVPTHKIILCRSPHFQNMFSSGMMESVSEEIELEGLNKEAFLEILNFIYRDKIEVTTSNCVGVLIYSLMFQLTVLASNCRILVEQNLTPTVACQLLNIADLYGDMILKRICIKFIKMNFENCSNLEDYEILDEIVRKEIEAAYQKYQTIQDKKNKKIKK